MKLTFGHLGLQFGGRIERNAYRPEAAAVPEREGIRDRDFTEFSGSVGLLGYLRDDVGLALNVAHAVRAPALEELYNFGPHPGNFAFETGNPDLAAERCWCFDLTLRWRRPRFEGAITGFLSRIDGFIFPLPTGELEDGFPVLVFTSSDATLAGFEAHVDVGLAPALRLELGGDLVRGEQRASGDPLPRIPPARGWVGLRFEKAGFDAEARLLAADRQDRVYGFETPTAGYGLVDVRASYRFPAGRTVHAVTLRLDNATDRLYRNHLSYIKELAPEIGRTVKLVYTVRF
jgi:iron complex outermembrane receptor protein